MRKTQEHFYDLYAQTGVTRAYVSNVVPGFFQTPAYATALTEAITDFQGTPNDVSEAVAARVARSRFLYEGGHRFVVLMEESALRYRIGDAETMAGQLRHLLAEANVVQPRELADYRKAFAELTKMAVRGNAVRALIEAAIDSLG